ncbi:tetratricopeptide repeat protein [Paenibacillus amylolyticus]|uniref:tetratricopeptide repeat protein n=1 Tax=Paenibacillus amylolyticus TaxID=1451 RepID=UPI003EBA4605
MFTSSLWNLGSWANAFTIIGVCIPLITAIIGVSKYIKKTKRKTIFSDSKPDIAYFTDRIEITKDIFEELQSSNGRQMFQIFGPPGVGRTEFAKLINMAVNYNCQTQDEENFINSTGYKKELNVQAFFITCEDESSYQMAVKQIFELLLIDREPGLSYALTAHLIAKKIRNKKRTVFIFDDIKNYDEKDKFYKLCNEIIGKLKKMNLNSQCIFMLFYSGAVERKEINNSNIRTSDILNFEKDYMIEYLDKKNISLNDTDNDKLFSLTNGNIHTLSLIADKYNADINNEKMNSINWEHVTDIFYQDINDDEKRLFRCILSLSISKNEVSRKMLESLNDSAPDTIRKQLDKLVIEGLLRKNKNFSYSVTEALLLPSINKEIEYIQYFQNKILDLVQQQKLFVEHKIVHEFIQSIETDVKAKHIINTLKINNDAKDYTATLRIRYLFKNVFVLKEQIEHHNEVDSVLFFEKLSYYIAEALTGYGAYQDAIEEIEMNTNHSIVRPDTVSSDNFDIVFLLGNLYHLQNEYAKAIEHFKKMIDSTHVRQSLKYKSKCYWAVAHCYRHMGLLDLAIDFYKESIEICKIDTVQTRDIYIKCMNEMNNIFFYRNEKQPFSFNTIDSFIKEENSVADLSTNKYKAIEHGIQGNFDKGIHLLEKTIKIYEKKSERLQFNLYFEMGELLRRKKDFKQSIDYFKKSLDASLLNGDKNIELYSSLGILSVELETKQHHFTNSKDEQYQLLEHCLGLCKDKDENVCFELGKQHVGTILNILNNKEPSLYDKMLPLF